MQSKAATKMISKLIDQYAELEARVKALEKIATSFPGVEDAYAISAGRELRVIIKSTEISDEQAGRLAHDITKRIRGEVVSPGGVKVVVIREARFEEQT